MSGAPTSGLFNEEETDGPGRFLKEKTEEVTGPLAIDLGPTGRSPCPGLQLQAYSMKRRRTDLVGF